MQSEAGAAGALHGCGAAGGLATSFTSCQGLLLMIPNLYKLSGERIPAVLHVAARQVGCAGTSIYCDHTDVMSVRMCGLAQIASASVQEAMDLAAVSHSAAIRAGAAFMHFFDGFSTSHSVASCKVISYEQLRTLVDDAGLQRLHEAALDPAHPTQRGTIVTRGDWMQMSEGVNTLYERDIPAAVERAMADVEKLTGRHYSLFHYAGAKDAERVIVAMGTGGLTVEEVVDEMSQHENEKVGVVRVRLFRPWVAERFLEVLPKTVKRIAVMERTKEPGSNGEPLFLDVLATIAESANFGGKVTVVGGRYGLADKAFTPSMVRAIFANLAAEQPKKRFVVGVDDDLTRLSLPLAPAPIPKGAAAMTQCTLWGMGSDGTVGAAQMAIRLVTCGAHGPGGAPVYAQGQFHFTAHKSGGVTISYLRFGPEPVKASYPIDYADYVAVHHPSYVGRYPLLNSAKPGATLLFQAPWTPEILEQRLPAAWRRKIAELGLKVFLIDALKVSRACGLGGHYNLVLLTAFFKLSGVLPVDTAIPLLKEATRKQYAKKGDAIIKSNMDAIDNALSGLLVIQYDRAAWAAAKDETPAATTVQHHLPPGVDPVFEEKIKLPLSRFEGDAVPVSCFETLLPAGRAPSNTTRTEKRAVATEVPMWKADKCVQCNFCSFVCPHAVIRPFLMTEAEAAAAPGGPLVTKPATGAAGAGLQFRIQISPLDCLGCSVCAASCPAKALEMRPLDEIAPVEAPHWEYCFEKLPVRAGLYPIETARGSQFLQPLFEFNGSCSGCGEAPYIKLLSQLYGDRAICACASGCNVAYSFALGSNPYSTNPEGHGPASAHSLFEDTAELGFGISRTRRVRRELYAEQVHQLLASPNNGGASEALAAHLKRWLEQRDDPAASETARKALLPLLQSEQAAVPALAALFRERELLTKATVWCIGGDGWSCDIDYGGLDHVLASNEPVRILVLDTEVYSNTGGQKSKGTPMGSVHKFEASGKATHKKDLGQIFMMNGNVYIASVCLYANPAQCLRAFLEAEAYPGPSMILAYSTCIEHGIEGTGAEWVAQAKRAVDSGYWPIYRYNPLLKAQGKNPFILDGPVKIKATVGEFIAHENRFQRLVRENPERSKRLHAELQEHVTERMARLQALAAQKPEEKK